MKQIINEELIQFIPMVSISMLTFNHERYIERAIVSVLEQETTFPYQLIIGEDCSTDSTREIVLKYAHMYPDKIVAILHNENGGIENNVLSVRKFLRGKYIAILEGDDFWCDKLKLQKQVNFLENRTDFVAVCHKHLDVDEYGNEITGLYKVELNSGYSPSKYYDKNELSKYYLAGHASSLLYLNIFNILNHNQIRIYNQCNVVGDRKLNLVLAFLGKVYRLDDVMSAYRHHTSSWTKSYKVESLSYYGYLSISNLEKLAYDMFGKKLSFDYGRMKSWYGVCCDFVKNPSISRFKILLKVLNDGNRFKKILFLFSHTLSYPYRRYIKNRIDCLL